MASQESFQIDAYRINRSIRRYTNLENHLSKNRLGDAEKIVIKAAETNGKELDTPIFIAEEDKNDDAPKKNACSDFLAMFGDIWNVISGEIS